MVKSWYTSILHQNIYGVGIQLALLIGGIGSAILFPRILGPELFGNFALVFALANFWLIFTNFIDQAVIKFVSASRVRKNTKLVIKLFLEWKTLLTIIASLALFLSSSYIANYIFHKPELSLGIKLSSLYIFFYSFYTLTDSALTGLFDNFPVMLAQFIYHTGRVLIPLMLVTLWFSYLSVISGIIIAGIIALGITLKALLGHYRRYKDVKFKIDAKPIKKFVFYCALTYFGQVLLQWIDALTLGVFRKSAEVGFYRIGMMWVSSTGLFIPISSRVLFAAYAQKYEEKAIMHSRSLFLYSLRYGFIFAFLLITLMLLYSDYLVGIIYGPEFSKSSTILAILSLLSVEILLTSTTKPLLWGVGKVEITTFYTLGIGILMTGLNYMVAPHYGAEGVAFVTMSLRLAGSIALTLYCSKLLKVKLPYTYWLKPMGVSFVLLSIFLPFKESITSLSTFLFSALLTLILYTTFIFTTKALTLKEVEKIIKGIKP